VAAEAECLGDLLHHALDHVGHLVVGGGRQPVEEAAVVVNPVEKKSMEMRGEIDRGTEALHEDHRAGLGGVDPMAAGLGALEAKDGAHEAAPDVGQQIRIEGDEIAQRERQGEHPLAHGHRG